MIDFDKEEKKLDWILSNPMNRYDDMERRFTPSKPSEYLIKFHEAVNLLFIKADYNEIDRVYQLVSIIARRHNFPELQININGMRDEALRRHLPLPDLPRSNDRPLTKPNQAQNTTDTTNKTKLPRKSLWSTDHPITSIICGVIVVIICFVIFNWEKCYTFVKAWFHGSK